MKPHQADEEETRAEAEISAAADAAASASPEERIGGLGPSSAPLYLRIRPSGGIPEQYNQSPVGPDEKTPLLTYFAIRGLGEVQRLLLAEANVPHDHLVVMGGEPQAVSAEWRGRSPNGLLPTLSGMGIPRSRPLCQSGATIRFLARRLGMAGGTELEAATADMLYETAKDMMQNRQLIAAETKPGVSCSDHRDASSETDAKLPFRAAGLLTERVLPHMPDPADPDAAVNFGQVQLFRVLHACEVLREGCVRENLGAPMDEFRRAMEARPRIAAYLSSTRFFPPTKNEVGGGGYEYAGGASLRRGDIG